MLCVAVVAGFAWFIETYFALESSALHLGLFSFVRYADWADRTCGNTQERSNKAWPASGWFGSALRPAHHDTLLEFDGGMCGFFVHAPC